MALADRVVDGARTLGLDVLELGGDERSAIVSLGLPRRVASRLTAAAAVERLQSEHSILITSRGGRLRVSAHIPNRPADVDALVAALGELLR